MTNATTTTPLRLIKLPEVMDRTGLSRSTIYQMLDLGTFPKPCKLNERVNGWVDRELNEWIEARIAERDNV